MRNLNLYIPTLDNDNTYVTPVSYPVVYNYPQEIVKAAAALGITPAEFIEAQQKAAETAAKQGTISQGKTKSSTEKAIAKEQVKKQGEKEKALEELQKQEQADEIVDAIGNGALSLTMPSTYINAGLSLAGQQPLNFGESLATDVLVGGGLGYLGKAGKLAQTANKLNRLAHTKYTFKPHYNELSYIRQIGNDAVTPIKTKGILESHSHAKSLESNRLEKLFPEQMFYTGRPFYGLRDKRYQNYIVLDSQPLTKIDQLTGKNIEWFESPHKNRSQKARGAAIKAGKDPDTASGRIVVPQYNGDVNIIPVEALGETATLYEPVTLGKIQLPFYKATKLSEFSNLNPIPITKNFKSGGTINYLQGGGGVSSQLNAIKSYRPNGFDNAEDLTDQPKTRSPYLGEPKPLPKKLQTGDPEKDAELQDIINHYPHEEGLENDNTLFWLLLTGLTAGAGVGAGSMLLPKLGRKMAPILLTKGPIPWWQKAIRAVGKFIQKPAVGKAVDIINPFFKSGGKINYLNLFK